MADGECWRFGAGVLFLWMALAAPASAGEWQYLSGDGTQSTLDCFGDFEEAECAAETYLACATWFPIIAEGRDYYGYGESYHDLSLCEGTWSGNEGGYPVGLSNEGWKEDQRAHLLFRFSEPWVLEKEDMVTAGWRREPASFNARASDTVFDFESIGCYPGPPCRAPGRFDCPITYCRDQNTAGIETFMTEPSGTFKFPDGIVVLRQEEGRWRLVNIHDWFYSNYRQDEQSWRPLHYRIGPVDE